MRVIVTVTALVIIDLLRADPVDAWKPEMSEASFKLFYKHYKSSYLSVAEFMFDADLLEESDIYASHFVEATKTMNQKWKQHPIYEILCDMTRNTYVDHSPRSCVTTAAQAVQRFQACTQNCSTKERRTVKKGKRC